MGKTREKTERRVKEPSEIIMEMEESETEEMEQIVVKCRRGVLELILTDVPTPWGTKKGVIVRAIGDNGRVSISGYYSVGLLNKSDKELCRKFLGF